MAALILEIRDRRGSALHRIERQVTRIGRAYDNDIILTDPSVSPHHCVIRRDAEGRMILQSIADENGIRLGNRRVDQVELDGGDIVTLDLGRTQVRLFDDSQPVAPTRPIGCRSGACVFGSWTWAIALFAVLVALSAIDNFLATPLEISWDTYWEDQVVIVVVAITLSVGLLLLNRLTAHRWDYASSLVFVSLVLSLAFVIDLLFPFIDYYFNSPIPTQAVDILWSLVFMPLALTWFLLRLQHGNTVSSLVAVALLLAPAAYFQVKEVGKYHELWGSFTRTAYYSSTLVPGDLRSTDTLSLESFAARQTERFVSSPKAAE
jgi:hypothetical protein